MSDEAPDIIGPVTAWRAWEVKDVPEYTPPLLYSMAWPFVWGPHEDQHARCGMRAEAHDAPATVCGCGIYVMNTLEDLLAEPTQVQHTMSFWRYGKARTAVIGEVEAWGRSVKHREGRRVEFARIKSLVSTPLVNRLEVNVTELAARYGVPLIVRSEVDDCLERIERQEVGDLDDAFDALSRAMQAMSDQIRQQMEEVAKRTTGVTQALLSTYRKPERTPRTQVYVAQDGTTYDLTGSVVQHHTAGFKATDPFPNNGPEPAEAKDPDKPIPRKRQDHLELRPNDWRKLR